MKLFYLFIVALLCLTSCKTITALHKMNAETADYETWTNGTGKTVVFLPMVHAGKPEFYEEVKKLIAQYKSEGYVVYYEGLIKNFNEALGKDSALREKYINYAKTTRYGEMQFQDTDSIDRLVCLLKFKRMIRFIPDSASYSKMVKNSPLTKKAVFQPRMDSLGISSPDLNIDISPAELVDEYESKHGVIELEQIDFAVALNDILPGYRRLRKKNVSKLIIDYRNQNLARNIQSSAHPKLIVLYGLAHMNGTFRELKKTDPSWKELDH